MPAEARRLLGGAGGVEALAAERLVDVGLAELDKLRACGETVGVVGELAAFDADGMDLLDILGDGHQERHRAERLAEIVGVKAGDDDAHALVGKCLDDLDDAEVEELGLVDADDLDIIRDGEHLDRSVDRCGGHTVKVVRHDLDVRIAVIYRRLEDGNLLVGKLGSSEPSQEFLCLTREH